MDKKYILIFAGIIVLSMTILFLLKYDIKITGKTIVQENLEVREIEELDEYEWPVWDHMPITYSFIEVPSDNGVYKCIEPKKKLINKAFNIIQDSTNNVEFEEVEYNEDIRVYCVPQEIYHSDDYYVTIAEALPEIEYDKIISGELYFYTYSFPDLGVSNCYDTQMHEILHLFDFYDDENLEGIMSQVDQTQCLYKIDDWITYQLDELY